MCYRKSPFALCHNDLDKFELSRTRLCYFCYFCTRLNFSALQTMR